MSKKPLSAALRAFVCVCVLALALAAAAAPARADVTVTRSGFISVLRLLTSETQKAGEEVSFKLSVTKSGHLTAVLTEKASGAKSTVLSRDFDGPTSTKLTIPGSKMIDDKDYVLTLTLVRGGQVVGTAEAQLSTKKVIAEVTSLSATSSFKPATGGTCAVKVQVASPATVTVVVADASGATVATLASGAQVSQSESFIWNGVTKAGTIAPDGYYTVRAYCRNSAGTSPTVTAKVRLTGAADAAVYGQTSGTLRSAVIKTRPSVGKPLQLTLNASQAGPYQLKLKDSTSGKAVKMAGTLKAGSNVISVDPSILVKGHKYVWQIIQQDGGTTVGKAQLSFTAYADPPVLSSLTAGTVKAAFGMSMPITYTVDCSASVTVTVVDAKGKVVARPATNRAVSAGTETIYWNGRNAKGAMLADGTYTLRVVATNAGGSSKTLTRSFQYAQGQTGLPQPGSSGAITMCTLLTDPQQVERTAARLLLQTNQTGILKITLNQLNTKTTKVVYNKLVKTGTNTISIPGSYLRAHTYIATLTLTGKTGDVIGSAVVSVHPVIVQPKITTFSCESTFGTKWIGLCSGKMTMSSNGYMTVTVTNSAGKVIRTICSRRYASAGTQVFSWDGLTTSKKQAPDGVYTISGYYTDDYGKVSNTMTSTVTLSSAQSYPKGVYGYATIGVGNHKTPIEIYKTPGGASIGVTYAVSATFTVLEDFGEYVYAECCRMEGAPLRGYVKASQLQVKAITSPYRIEVCISRTGAKAQTLYLYKDGVLLDSFKVSTGEVEGSTPTGTYLILNRMPYFYNGSLRCEHALRVVGGVCIHRVPLFKDSYAATTKLLGKPASHGCIRVPVEKSEWLYNNIPDTTPVYMYYG